jgi:glycosyltransferase involved in cell wall biosynthesis
MNTIFIIPIEPIDTRYTRHWYEHIPELLKAAGDDRYRVITIDGTDVPPVPTPGAFLDFGATNIYKSSQLIKIADKFRRGEVKDGDKFLFTDAWNTSILQVKYMSELLGVKTELHGLWHAGSYDPQDFLGRLIKDKRWTNNTEKAIFYSLDKNWFATEFHVEMFMANVFLETDVFKNDQDLSHSDRTRRIGITGWPMEYMTEMLERYEAPKKDLILFPHRLAPEKQLDIFKDLEKELPEYEWVVCQEKKLTKNEYHKLLGRAKMVFSANLQETLGISVPEGMATGAIPCVPDRLSYAEMYRDEWKYPSEWTESFDSYTRYKEKLVSRIKEHMESYDEKMREVIYDDYKVLHEKFFSAGPLVESLVSE